jgi:hypothetical protein
MYLFLYRLGTWLLQKVGIAVLIAVVALVGMGLWLYARDQVDSETRRLEYVAQLEVTKRAVMKAQEQTQHAIMALKDSVEKQEARVMQANRVIKTLRELENWWAGLFGDSVQQQINADRVARMESLKVDASATIARHIHDLGVEAGKVQDLDFRLQSIERDIVGSRDSESAAAHYLRSAWNRSKGYLLVTLLIYFFGPSVVKLLAYYIFAPWLSRGKAIRFESELLAMPNVRPSKVSADVGLWPGEVLRVKEKFLQSSDEGLIKKTRFVFDWAIPLTSVACGLTELVELRNGHAGVRAALTLSNSDDPHSELATIEVPDGAGIILRPSFLVGVITAGEDKVTIRRRWMLFRWQAWITLQFRFFEFVGPCRLIVAGTRGVKAEVLAQQEGISRAARRTNQRATIGFTPSLDYLPVRAETFWGYYRNMNPLFDDLFAGSGLFILQETSSEPGKGAPMKFWETVWSSVLKVFGI